MQEIISAVFLIATLFGGTVMADKIFHKVREAALTKAAQGLPKLSSFSSELTMTRNAKRGAKNSEEQKEARSSE
jgi:hypothetical protein